MQSLALLNYTFEVHHWFFSQLSYLFNGLKDRNYFLMIWNRSIRNTLISRSVIIDFFAGTFLFLLPIFSFILTPTFFRVKTKLSLCKLVNKRHQLMRTIRNQWKAGRMMLVISRCKEGQSQDYF